MRLTLGASLYVTGTADDYWGLSKTDGVKAAKRETGEQRDGWTVRQIARQMDEQRRMANGQIDRRQRGGRKADGQRDRQAQQMDDIQTERHEQKDGQVQSRVTDGQRNRQTEIDGRQTD